jgi:hypothetical protein
VGMAGEEEIAKAAVLNVRRAEEKEGERGVERERGEWRRGERGVEGREGNGRSVINPNNPSTLTTLLTLLT